MPTLLPRRFAGMASILHIPAQRPSLYRHEVGNRIKFTRLHLGSLALRPISLPVRNSRPLITQMPLLRAIKAYGQLLERDFNPLAKSLLLRTSDPRYARVVTRTLSPTLARNYSRKTLVKTVFDALGTKRIFGMHLQCD